MPACPITKALLAAPPAVPEGKAKVRVFDTRTRGFIAEVRRSCITFYFRYTDARGRGREVKLGRLGDVTLEQARRRADQLKAETSLGADPVADADKRRAVPTVAAFIEERYMPHVRDRLRSHDTVAVFCRRITEALGRKALDEVSQADVASFRRRMMGTGLSNASVNRHLATLRSMFNLALRWQLYEGRNPAASPGMLRETHRDVYLTAQETQALVRALDAEPNQDAAAALMLLIVTGARKSEVLTARWENVDLDRCLLTVPRSKSGKTRYIPLSELAVRVLVRQYQRRVRLPRPPPRAASGGPAGAVEARQTGDGAAARHPDSRSAAQLRLGAGEPGRAAQRDRRDPGPQPTRHHCPLRPPRAAAAGADGDGGGAGVELVGGTGGIGKAGAACPGPPPPLTEASHFFPCVRTTRKGLSLSAKDIRVRFEIKGWAP
jgi:integrase